MKQLKIVQLVSFMALSAFLFHATAQRIDLAVYYGYQSGTIKIRL
ncbi:hypothetical protein [uncultured Eudoraea sp.]|nr:hypothetical protein [uncultured Eudoraea sp.]